MRVKEGEREGRREGVRKQGRESEIERLEEEGVSGEDDVLTRWAAINTRSSLVF